MMFFFVDIWFIFWYVTKIYIGECQTVDELHFFIIEMDSYVKWIEIFFNYVAETVYVFELLVIQILFTAVMLAYYSDIVCVFVLDDARCDFVVVIVIDIHQIFLVDNHFLFQMFLYLSDK